MGEKHILSLHRGWERYKGLWDKSGRSSDDWQDKNAWKKALKFFFLLMHNNIQVLHLSMITHSKFYICVYELANMF